MQTDSIAYASLVLSWDLPAGTWDNLRLVRNAAGTPRYYDDGDVVFTDAFADARTSYVDEQLTAGRDYYYALFTDTSGVWTRVADTSGLVATQWGTAARLYNRIPESLRSDDYNVVSLSPPDEEDSFLYKFVGMLGFQFDLVRTEIESLRNLRDPNLVSQRMLPALSPEVGVDYEPEIGAAVLRHFIANAIHLWSIKGTIPGVRELASVLTGYVTHVRIGRNLALDNLDAGPIAGKGRWHGRTNCAVTYRANTVTDANPAGDGVLLLTPTGTGVTAADMNLGATALQRMQYAIPILPDLDYTVSQYVRRTGGTFTARMLIQWLDETGATIGATTGTALATANTTWTRLSSTATAPSNARYLEASLVTSSIGAGQTLEMSGFMVQEDDTLDTWQCAREILVYLDPQIINYVGNTSGSDATSTGWSTGVEAVSDTDLGLFLVKFVPDPPDPDDIYPLDALLVDLAGDSPPADPPPEDSLAPTEMWYPDAHQAVAAGQVWSALVEAIPPLGDDGTVPRYGRVGFRLYSGSTLVGHDVSTEVLLPTDVFTPLSHELTVPDDADYDHIEFTLITEGLCGFRHAALERVNLPGAFYFDGSTPSDTNDFLWTGTAFHSPTAYYQRRAARTARLKALLNDYLPYGCCYDVVFGVDVVPDSPQSVSGVNPDPATTLPL